MNYQDTKIPLKEITKVFKQINVKDILSISKDIQKRLITDKSLILQDNKNKLVTQADVEIQELLLDYFDNSSLKGTYQIITEEVISRKYNNKNTSWKLIIDPLDGTSSFNKQNKLWGVMVGACDIKGILRYSWNLLSTGEIFTSNSKSIKNEPFQKKINSGKLLLIDVYDYDSIAPERFKTNFENIFGIPANKVSQTSYPTAIWAGYKLYTRSLDGLLLLSSKKGKRWYPEYDLIFLGTLLNQGYNIIIGRIGNKNCLVAVAPTLDDVEKLYKTGLLLQTFNKRTKNEKIY